MGFFVWILGYGMIERMIKLIFVFILVEELDINFYMNKL